MIKERLTESSLHRGMSKTISPSVQARNELLQLLHEEKIKPHMGRDRSLGPIEYNGQKLFVKKAVKSRKKENSSTADLHLRPDILVKYRKLLFNKMCDIQEQRETLGGTNFYSIKGPDIYAVDKTFLVTERLSNVAYMQWMGKPVWFLKILQTRAYDLEYHLNSYRRVRNRNNLSDKDKERKERRYDDFFSWRVHRKFENNIGTLWIDGEEPATHPDGFWVKVEIGEEYNNYRKIHSTGARRKNLLAGREQCKEDFETAYATLKQELNGDKKIGVDGIQVFDKEGKSYGVKDDVFHFEKDFVFGKRIDNKPEFILMDELWIKDLSRKET